jgi:hypothetical protein
VLSGGRRQMLDQGEWQWFGEQLNGDFDHLLIASTLPVLLAPAIHYLEAWNEAVCDGAWGNLAARLGERLRRAFDLEHWAAFEGSFRSLIESVRQVAAGERGAAPASVCFLGGDVHQAYLSEVAFPREAGVSSAVYQAVCSPFRNPLDRRERAVLGLLRRSRLLRASIRGLAHRAGVGDPGVRWREVQEPTFDNQVATLRFDGRKAHLRIERTHAGDGTRADLVTSLDRDLV